MSLVDGVPPDGQADTTALGDPLYQHDDHHRALATAIESLQLELATTQVTVDAYLEFLADSQTPYYLAANNSDHTDPAPSNTLALWVGQADKFDEPPAPSVPLGALTSPFVGPGAVTTPIPAPQNWYDGPGAFRTLKTGVIAIQFDVIAQFAAPVAAPVMHFQLWAEDGVQQLTDPLNHPSVFPAGAAGWAGGSTTSRYGGTALVTVVEADRISGALPGPSPSLYGGQIRLETGIVPLGWDIYPVLQMRSQAGGIIDWQVDHLGMQIAKIA
jgi:hypothetical protein